MTKTTIMIFVSFLLASTVAFGEANLGTPNHQVQQIQDSLFLIHLSVDYSGDDIEQFSPPATVSADTGEGRPWHDDMHPRVQMRIEEIIGAEDENMRYMVWMTGLQPQVRYNEKYWHPMLSILYSDGTPRIECEDFSDGWYDPLFAKGYPSHSVEVITPDTLIHVYTIWTDKRNGTPEIYYSKVKIYRDALGEWQREDLTNPDVCISPVDDCASGRWIDPYDYEKPELPPDAISSETEITCGEARFFEHPEVAMDQYGDLYSVYSDKRSGEWAVYLTKHTSDDASTTIYEKWIGGKKTPGKIPHPTIGEIPNLDAFSPSIAIDDWNSKLQIVYQGRRSHEHGGMISFSPYRIWFRELDLSSGRTLRTMALTPPNREAASPNILITHRPPPYSWDYPFVTWMQRDSQKWGVYFKGLRWTEDAVRVSQTTGNAMYPRLSFAWSAEIPLAQPQLPVIPVIGIVWQDLRDLDWRVYYSRYGGEHIFTEPPYWIVTNRKIAKGKDLYPDIELVGPAHHKYAFISFQRLRSEHQDWETVWSSHNPLQFLDLVLKEGGDSATYSLFPKYSSDRSDVAYSWEFSLRPGDYTYYIEAENCLGEYVRTDDIGLTLSDRGGRGQSVDVERGIDFSSYASPNPLTTSTDICFALPTDSHVRLEIYNLAGQLVETLLDEPMSTGLHKANWNTENAASGVYFYRIQTHTGIGTENQTATKKITVLR